MTPGEPKWALWVGHGLEPRPQFHEKDPRERRKNEICDGRGKKSEILGGQGEGRSGGEGPGGGNEKKTKKNISKINQHWAKIKKSRNRGKKKKSKNEKRDKK